MKLKFSAHMETMGEHKLRSIVLLTDLIKTTSFDSKFLHKDPYKSRMREIRKEVSITKTSGHIGYLA
jgi:hypothetical protein